MYIPLEYYENNFVGSMNLVKMMQLFPACNEFIFSSSAAVYGEQDNCSEDFACRPISPYGESKLCVDMFLRSMARAHPEWRIISLRYFNPAGNHLAGLLGDNPIGNTPANLFSIIQEVIINKRTHVVVYGSDYNTPDGTGVRDFVHVVDLAKGHLQALQYMQTMSGNYDVFNFGSGSGFSVLEVLKQFSELLGEDIRFSFGERRKGDLERLVAASQKAEQLLGWKAEKSLREMCESCIKFTVTLKQEQQLQQRQESTL
jgi:UDP-glucose 4-epimerase